MSRAARVVAGIPAITDALAGFGLLASESTVRRLYKAGRLPGAFKLNPTRTSPVLMPLAEIEKLAKGGKS